MSNSLKSKRSFFQEYLGCIALPLVFLVLSCIGIFISKCIINSKNKSQNEAKAQLENFSKSAATQEFGKQLVKEFEICRPEVGLKRDNGLIQRKIWSSGGEIHIFEEYKRGLSENLGEDGFEDISDNLILLYWLGYPQIDSINRIHLHWKSYDSIKDSVIIELNILPRVFLNLDKKSLEQLSALQKGDSEESFKYYKKLLYNEIVKESEGVEIVRNSASGMKMKDIYDK